MLLAIASIAAFSAAAQLPAWQFDAQADLDAWPANAHLANVVLKDGVVSADAVDWDPFFHNRTVNFQATPWQYVLVRVKANKPGMCGLFWSGTFEGEYGGLTEKKKVEFPLKGDGTWEEHALFPFWQTEGAIRQLRFDVYNGARFDVDSIRVLEWGGGAPPRTDMYDWAYGGLPTDKDWFVEPGIPERFLPPMRLAVADKGFVTVEMTSDTDGVGGVLWACESERGMQSQYFTVRGDGKPHSYNVELRAVPSWRDPIVALGVRLPGKATVNLNWVSIADEPSGPGELYVSYFGFVDAPNRAGMPRQVLVRVANRNGGVNGIRDVGLTVPQGMRILKEPAKKFSEGIAFGEYEDFVWEVVADQPGEYTARAGFGGKNVPETAAAALHFTAPLGLPNAEYVPEPHPVQSDVDLCMYYFPGWTMSAKWDCIRDVAPIRKPMLGYYDEGNPECVDWQIKWAVENGIKCFLVDWYWCQGAQSLTHWFDAYRKARYRDKLDVAIMWANHNPPKTHSVEDWRAVTKEWIDKYFNLPAYYRIDGKPAVFIWAPGNLRNDLGGSETVRKCIEESQQAAKAAGYGGIMFIAMYYEKPQMDEGYSGFTTYHEWGSAPDVGPIPGRRRYEDVVNTAPAMWAERNNVPKSFAYYPVADTGWDSRPWHGDNYLVIEGRTPALFEQLLRSAKDFCAQNGKKILVLGPANEWGEGSYVEPNAEFGFDMYEAIRRVFAKGDPATWPVNIAPGDVGRGPYDFAPTAAVTSWTFDTGAEGWGPMMNLRDFRCEGGALRFRTTSDDPAITTGASKLQAKSFPMAEIRMQVVGDLSSGKQAQLFWSVGGSPMPEANSVHFPLETDGQMHAYRLDLAANPRWRGRISTLRFDPCGKQGVDVAIESFRLLDK